MKDLNALFILLLLFIAVVIAMPSLAPIVFPNKNRVENAMEFCEYIPHPISDVAWELYSREPDRYRIGAAVYYTKMMNSHNANAADCMIQRLEPFE